MSEGVQILRQLLSALAYLHGMVAPILHRDIKLGNILVQHRRDGEIHVKFGDFGLSREMQTSMSIVGTRPYYPPEFWFGARKINAEGYMTLRYTPAVDIWSLGLTVLFCVYRKPWPFSGQGMPWCGEIVNQLETMRSARPDALNQFLGDAMLILDPRSRWPAKDCHEQALRLPVQNHASFPPGVSQPQEYQQPANQSRGGDDQDDDEGDLSDDGGEGDSSEDGGEEDGHDDDKEDSSDDGGEEDSDDGGEGDSDYDDEDRQTVVLADADPTPNPRPILPGARGAAPPQTRKRSTRVSESGSVVSSNRRPKKRLLRSAAASGSRAHQLVKESIVEAPYDGPPITEVYKPAAAASKLRAGPWTRSEEDNYGLLVHFNTASVPEDGGTLGKGKGKAGNTREHATDGSAARSRR